LSFHTHYDEWIKMTDPQYCPVCNNSPMPAGMVDVVALPHSWLSAQPVDCLKGACHLIAKVHAVELFELNEAELLGLMKEVQVCAQALKRVTAAIKINYEIHGNSTPHLHLHLYPRYLDDPFPGKPIDYTRQVNWYSDEGFERFVADLRAEIARLRVGD
jgi:diadenosine tetraphosphate (Ap4A) HIT family hydrolase